MGGALALLFVLAAGAAAQQHLGDPPIAGSSSLEITELPGTPIGESSPGNVLNGLLQTELEDDATDGVLDNVPVRSAPVASEVIGLGDSSNSVKLTDLTDDAERDSDPSDLAVKPAEILDTGSINPFFIPDEEFSGTGNEAVAAIQDGIPLSAAGPQGPQNTPDPETSLAATAPQNTLNSLDAAEQTGTLQEDPLGKAGPQPASSEDAVKTTDQAGVTEDEEAIIEVSEPLDQGGVPKDLALAQISSADILEETSSRDTESLEVLYNDPTLAEVPDADDAASVEVLPLIDASSAPAEVATADPASAEAPDADPVPSGTPDVDTGDEEIQTVDPAPAAEAETVESEAPLEPSLPEIADNVVLREPQTPDIISPETQAPQDDTTATEVSSPAVAQAQVSQVLPTSPDADVQLVMAELAAAAPSEDQLGPQAAMVGDVDPSVSLVSEIKPTVEEVPASLEAVTLVTEPNGFGDVLLVEDEAPPAQAEENVKLPASLTQEEEIMKIPAEEGAAPAPETEVLVMDAEVRHSDLINSYNDFMRTCIRNVVNLYPSV